LIVAHQILEKILTENPKSEEKTYLEKERG
jgi:hypothetical protein